MGFLSQSKVLEDLMFEKCLEQLQELEQLKPQVQRAIRVTHQSFHTSRPCNYCGLAGNSFRVEFIYSEPIFEDCGGRIATYICEDFEECRFRTASGSGVPNQFEEMN